MDRRSGLCRENMVQTVPPRNVGSRLEENDLPTNNHAYKVHPQTSECIQKNQERIIYLVLERARMVCGHRNCKPPRTNDQPELLLI